MRFTLRNLRAGGSIETVKTSFPPSLQAATGLTGLARTLAPVPVQVTYCATNALPFRVEWQSERGPPRFYGITPDAAADEALSAMARGSVGRPTSQLPVTEPDPNRDWTEAMRELIADIEPARTPLRPLLRVVRGPVA